MVTARSETAPYRTQFVSDGHQAHADASIAKGGAGAGFGPHELLEASVASCINIWLRMHAERRGIPLSGLTAEVRLNRDVPGETIFECAVDLQGSLTPEQGRELQRQIVACPVSQTLLKTISFRDTSI